MSDPYAADEQAATAAIAQLVTDLEAEQAANAALQAQVADLQAQLAAVTSPPAPTPTPTPTPVPKAPLMAGLMVSTGAGRTGETAEATKYLGGPSPVSKLFLGAGTTMASLASSWYVTHGSVGTQATVVSVPLTEPGEGSGIKLTDIAAGNYDNYFRAAFSMLPGLGLASAMIQIGEEADETWADWAKQGDVAFKAAYRHLVGLARAVTGQKFTFDYNGPSSAQGRAFYPGDDIVTHMSADPYDTADWATIQANLLAGAQFAQAHGKPFGLSEWGLRDVAHGGKGDNPAFIQSIHDFAVQWCDWIIYFDEIDSALAQYPRSAALFKTLFAAG